MKYASLFILSLLYCVSVWNAPARTSSILALAYSFLLSVAIVPATLLVGILPSVAGAVLPLLLQTTSHK